MADVLAEKDSQKILVSSKWQQVGGTAEQKVPFELISLIEAIKGGPFTHAYLVSRWRRLDSSRLLDGRGIS